MKYRFISLFFLCIFLTSGCQQKPKFSDVFFNSSCALPCWNGLYPGISNETNLQNWLDSYSEIDSSDISLIENQGPFNSIYTLRFTDYEIGSSLFYKESELYALSLSGKLNISIQALIEKIGEPESIIIIHTVKPGKFYGDVFVDVVNLVFPKSGLIASFWSQNIAHLNVQGKDFIDELILSSTDDYLNILNLLVTPSFISTDTYNWEGYGTYPQLNRR